MPSSNDPPTSPSQTVPAPYGGSYPTAIQRVQYNGWNVYKLTNRIVSLLVAPDIGGRAIQLQLGDQEFFFVNKHLAGKILPPEQNNSRSGWANYGGDKVWPAPQGPASDSEWPGPPYYALDGSRFSSEVVKDSPVEVAIRVTSPPDSQTGIQFVRTFHLYAETTRIKVEQLMRNVSRRRIRWGIWHVLQNDAADASDPRKPNSELYMYVPLSPHSKYRDGYRIMFGDVRHPSYQVLRDQDMLRIHYLYRVGKVGIDTNSGWYAVVNGQKNIGYVENFKFFPALEYPDGASVESWNQGPSFLENDPSLPNDPEKVPYFMEAEVLSPFAELDPGEDYSFAVDWCPTRVPNPIRSAVWAGAISELLSGKVTGDQVRLQGVFGVYCPGTVEAVFYNSAGEVVYRENLQAVDPREVVRLDKSVTIPHGVYRVSVLVRDQENENQGYLGSVILK